MRYIRPVRSLESGNTILEFALVSAFLVPLFAGTFTIGMSLVKAIQVSNVCRTTDVLAVRGVDLSTAPNQQLVMRTASGLAMNTAGTYNPDPAGKGAVIVSKVILVGDKECASGVTPPPATAPPWDTSNCPNFGSYVFGQRIIIANQTRWSSATGNPPGGIVLTDGTISPQNIAMSTANRASGFPGIVDLGPVNSSNALALVTETFADITYLNMFSLITLYGNTGFTTPTVYSRNVS